MTKERIFKSKLLTQHFRDFLSLKENQTFSRQIWSCQQPYSLKPQHFDDFFKNDEFFQHFDIWQKSLKARLPAR